MAKIAEVNQDVMLKDITEIMEHLRNINKELQRVYIILSKVIKEATIETEVKEDG